MFCVDALLKAIKIIGSRQEVIKLLGISGQRLNAWLNGGVIMGYEYALVLEYLTCGEVIASELAPQKTQILNKLNINLKHPLTWLIKKQVPISNIKVSEHLSKPLDDIENLAADIKKQGLLRPIVIDSKYMLVLGERRLYANKLIKENNIPVFILSLEALLKDQDAGYQLKKYFILSERAAIGMALESVLGKKQGQRTDLQLLQNFAEVKAKTTTREKVALAIGFNNAETYRQAKKIIRTGIRLLINAMDEEKISISTATEIAVLPTEEQQQIMCGDYKFIMEKVKQIKMNKKLSLQRTKTI